MKIIIPTNDRKTVAVHTGRADEFAIYDIENGNIVSETYVTNPYTHQGNECGGGRSNVNCGHHNHKELVDFFCKADKLIYHGMGKHLRAELNEHNISYLKAKSIHLNKIATELQ